MQVQNIININSVWFFNLALGSINNVTRNFICFLQTFLLWTESSLVIFISKKYKNFNVNFGNWQGLKNETHLHKIIPKPHINTIKYVKVIDWILSDWTLQALNYRVGHFTFELWISYKKNLWIFFQKYGSIRKIEPFHLRMEHNIIQMTATAGLTVPHSISPIFQYIFDWPFAQTIET